MAENQKESKDVIVDIENESVTGNNPVTGNSPNTEGRVVVEYEAFPLLGHRKTSEEIRAEFKAKFDAEKPARDALQAKRKKVAKELVVLGLSEESAKFLTNLE